MKMESWEYDPFEPDRFGLVKGRNLIGMYPMILGDLPMPTIEQVDAITTEMGAAQGDWRTFQELSQDLMDLDGVRSAWVLLPCDGEPAAGFLIEVFRWAVGVFSMPGPAFTTTHDRRLTELCDAIEQTSERGHCHAGMVAQIMARSTPYYGSDLITQLIEN